MEQSGEMGNLLPSLPSHVTNPERGSGHERFGRIPAKRNAGARKSFSVKRSGGDRSGSCGDHRAGAFCFEIKDYKNPFRKPAERTCRFLKKGFYHVLESELRFYLFSVFFLRVTLKTNVRNRKPMIIQVTNTVVLCLLNIS